MIDALQTVSTFFGENTLHNRRNLRRDIEKRSLQINLEFLEQFKNVKEVNFNSFILIPCMFFLIHVNIFFALGA